MALKVDGNSKMKVLTMREFTHALSASLTDGGEFLIMKKDAPWRYLQVREVEVRQYGSEEESKVRESLKEESGQQKEVIVLKEAGR